MNPDCVHYKIFLCAAGYEPEIRRITIDRDICHNYFYLKQKILAIFPTLKDVAFTISWKDSEGDNIRICTDDELVIALKEMESQAFKKIYVNATPQGKEGPVHPDVVCDGCEHPLHGFRYKCLVCYDYDLCPDCERSQMHPDHPMLRIPLPLSPDMPFGRRFARDIAKMGKHLERLLHQTSDHGGDKKAKGDYSSGCRNGTSENRKHKMKFCHHSNDMQNFLHNLVYSQIEKMRGPSSGDNAASSSASNNPQQDNSEPQASSSSDVYPIFEEQKKFVNILTNGLNSFLDPLGIDIVVEEDPVKEESPQKRPQPSQPENNSGANMMSSNGGASTFQATPSSSAAPIVNQPGMTQMQPTPLSSDPVIPPVAVVEPVSQSDIGFTSHLSNIAAPVSVPSFSRVQPQVTSTAGVQPSLYNIGVPPPATMTNSQSSATVGVQPSQNIGFQLPAAIGVPPPAVIGVQPPPKVTVGPQVPVSSTAMPVLTPTVVQPPTVLQPPAQVQPPAPVQPPVQTVQPPAQVQPQQNPAPQPQVVSPARSYQSDDIPVLDNSWTIINDGMGESILIQTATPAPLGAAAAATATATASTSTSQTQSTQESERLYPQLLTPTELSTDEAMNIMGQLGFKDEEWLRQLVENKKGNIQEVLNFLSPIPKPKPSTNLLR